MIQPPLFLEGFPPWVSPKISHSSAGCRCCRPRLFRGGFAPDAGAHSNGLETPGRGWAGRQVLKMMPRFEGSGILRVYFLDLFAGFFCPKRHKLFFILAPWSGGK